MRHEHGREIDFLPYFIMCTYYQSRRLNGNVSACEYMSHPTAEPNFFLSHIEVENTSFFLREMMWVFTGGTATMFLFFIFSGWVSLREYLCTFLGFFFSLSWSRADTHTICVFVYTYIFPLKWWAGLNGAIFPCLRFLSPPCGDIKLTQNLKEINYTKFQL